MSVVGNIKSMTDGVDTLTKKVNELEGAIKTLSTSAEGAFKGVNGLLNEGGQRNLGRGNSRPGTGADSATFSNGVPQPMGNSMNSSLAGFSQFSPIGQYAAGNAGPIKATAAVGAVQGVLGLGSALMAGQMDTSGVVNRAMGYYQGVNYLGGSKSRAGVESSFLRSMNGGVTSVGSDAVAFSTLTNAGFMPGSKDMARAGAQIGAAANYMGVDNSVAASAIAQASSGQTAANLYQYGISTWNADGTKKDFSKIANDISNTIFDKNSKGYTAAGVQEAFRSGFTQQNLASMGVSGQEMQMYQQYFMAQVNGQGNDLTKMKAADNNQNPTDPYMQMNQSQTNLQGKTEAPMLQGLSTAADHVTKFNTAMEGLLKSTAGYQAYIDGISGTNVGKAAGKASNAAQKLGGAALVGAGLLLEPFSGGLSTTMVVGGAAMLATSGGTPGYGARVGGGRPGYGASIGPTYTGGGTPASGAAVSASYGATGSQWNSTTGGTHLGTDYVRPKGTPVHSHADGVVSGDVVSADYGNAVLIDHEGGFQTLYAHLNSKNVSPGTKVTAGQVIGTLGDSGKADGAHLHYEVRQGKNNPVDPSVMDAAYAGKMPVADVLGGNNSVGGNRSDYAFDVLRGSTSSAGTSSLSSSSGSGDSTPNPTGSYNASASSMQSWLVSQGLSQNGAFGVVANLLAESGLRTGAVGDSGTSYGIAQWHKERKDSLFKYAKDNGLEPNSLEAQQGFLMKELSGYGKLMGILQDPNTSQLDATSAFMKQFERPANTSDAAVQGRYNRGLGALQQADSKTGGGTPGAGGAGLSPTAPTPHAQAAYIDSPSPKSDGGTKNVYITVTIDQASHQQMVSFAEGVQKILEDKNHTVRLGM